MAEAAEGAYRQVDWVVSCQTLVYASTDDEAKKQVGDMFEQRPWGDPGKCVATMESMKITDVSIAKQVQ